MGNVTGINPNQKNKKGIPADSLDEYSDLPDMVERYQWLTEAALSRMVRFKEDNGLIDAVVPLGNKYLIHRPSFLKWIEKQRGMSA